MQLRFQTNLFSQLARKRSSQNKTKTFCLFTTKMRHSIIARNDIYGKTALAVILELLYFFEFSGNLLKFPYNLIGKF